MTATYLAFVASRMEFSEFVRPEDWKFTNPTGHPAVVEGEVVGKAINAEKNAAPDMSLDAASLSDRLRAVEAAEIEPARLADGHVQA